MDDKKEDVLDEYLRLDLDNGWQYYGLQHHYQPFMKGKIDLFKCPSCRAKPTTYKKGRYLKIRCHGCGYERVRRLDQENVPIRDMPPEIKAPKVKKEKPAFSSAKLRQVIDVLKELGADTNPIEEHILEERCISIGVKIEELAIIIERMHQNQLLLEPKRGMLRYIGTEEEKI